MDKREKAKALDEKAKKKSASASASKAEKTKEKVRRGGEKTCIDAIVVAVENVVDGCTPIRRTKSESNVF